MRRTFLALVLFAAPAAAAEPGYVGVWATSAKACKASTSETDDVSFKITRRGLNGHKTECAITRSTAVPKGWRVHFRCMFEGESTESDVIYRIDGGRLTATEQGTTQNYVRCEDGDFWGRPSSWK